MAAPGQLHEFEFSEPTYCRLKHSLNPRLKAELKHLKAILSAFADSQRQHDKILSETKILHAMIRRRNRQMRREKSLQLLKRVQACVKRISLFGKLFRVVNDVYRDLLSVVAEMTEEGETVYLPAQQTWSYLLYLQLQYSKLLEKTRSYCLTTFEQLSCQFATGIYIPQMMIFMGNVARIWLLSKTLAKKMQNFYSQIYLFREHVERTQSEWKDPVLPGALQLYIDDSTSSDLEERISVASKKLFKEGMEVCEGDVLIDKVLYTSDETADQSFIYGTEEVEDIGEPVAIKRKADDSIAILMNNKRRRTDTDKKAHYKKKKRKAKNTVQTSGSADFFPDTSAENSKAHLSTKQKKRTKKIAGEEKGSEKKKKFTGTKVTKMAPESQTLSIRHGSTSEILNSSTLEFGLNKGSITQSVITKKLKKKKKKNKSGKAPNQQDKQSFQTITDSFDNLYGKSMKVKTENKVKKRKKMKQQKQKGHTADSKAPNDLKLKKKMEHSARARLKQRKAKHSMVS